MNMLLSLNVFRLQLKVRLAELFRVVELAMGRYSINRSTLYSLQVLQGFKNNAKKGLFTHLFCQPKFLETRRGRPR